MRARRRVLLDDLHDHARVAQEMVGQLVEESHYARRPVPPRVADLYMRIGQLRSRLRDADPRCRDRWWRWRTR